MGFFYTLVLLIAGGFIGNLLMSFLLPYAGFIGTVIAGGAVRHRSFRFNFGTGIVSICQAYIYLSYVAILVLLANNSNTNSVGHIVLAIICFICAVVPLAFAVGQRANHHKNDPIYKEYLNPQVDGLQWAFVICIIGGTIMAFNENFINNVWPWVYTAFYKLAK